MAAAPTTGTSSPSNVANQTTNPNSTTITSTTTTTTYSNTVSTSTPTPSTATTTTAMTKATSPDMTTNLTSKSSSDSSTNNNNSSNNIISNNSLSPSSAPTTTSNATSNLNVSNNSSNNQIKQQPKSQQQTVVDCKNLSLSSPSAAASVSSSSPSSSAPPPSTDSTTIATSKTESDGAKSNASANKAINLNVDPKSQENLFTNNNETDASNATKIPRNSSEQSTDAFKNNDDNSLNGNSNSSNSVNISNNNLVTSKSIAPQATSSVASITAPTSSISSSGISNASSGSAHDHAPGGNSSTNEAGTYISHESNGPLGNRDFLSRNNNNAKMDNNPQQQQNSYQHHNKSTSNQHHHHHHHHNNQQQSHAHQNQHHSHHHNEQLSKTNLYIKGLNADTSDHDLFSLCNRYGPIVSTKAILDKNTNKCKGYGFVDFETPASAEIAVVELQKQGILVHMAKQQEADPTNLYIVNLPQMMTESELEDLLRPYGQVVSTRILINQNRQPRGVGFARMETKEQCDAIIASLNGQIIKGSKEPLLVKFADGASKKRVHHFQHKPLGGNAFMGDHLWRNSSNDTNYHMMNSGGPGNRNFHGGSFDHSRQNHSMSHHNNGLVKHQQMMSLSGYPHHQGGHHPHSSAHHNHQQHHQPQLQHHHHGHNHSSHSSHRNQNQGLYTGGTTFPISASMSGANDASQWLHPPQAGQP